MTRFITFFVASPNAIDLDCNVPLVLEYAKTRKVLIVCSEILSFENSLLNKFPVLEDNANVRIIYLDKIFSLRILINFGFKNRKLLKIFAKISLLFNNLNNLKRICNNSDLIFATNLLQDRGKTVEEIFYKYSKESDAIFIGNQLVPWVSWYQSYLFDFDYFLCSSKDEYEELKTKKLDVKIVFKGCPSFDINYLNLFGDKNSSLNNNIKSKTALFIMSNRKTPMYINHAVIYKEVKDFIRFLESHSYKCIMRLHPSSQVQDKIEFNKIGINNSYIIQDSIETISSKIDIAISFISTASLKCIAHKIPTVTYIPDSLIESFSSFDIDSQSKLFSGNEKIINQFTNFYFKSKDFNKYRLEDFSHVIKKPEDIMKISESEQKKKHEIFLENFKPQNASANILEFFNTILKYEK